MCEQDKPGSKRGLLLSALLTAFSIIRTTLWLIRRSDDLTNWFR